MSSQAEITRRIRAVYDESRAQHQASPTLVQLETKLSESAGHVSPDASLSLSELDWIAAQLQLNSTEKLLDLACGSGALSCTLAAKIGCGTVGTDLMAPNIADARRRARGMHLDTRVHFAQADAGEGLSFAREAFNSSLCLDAFIHFRDQAALLTDLARVMKRRGRLALGTVLGKHLTQAQAQVLDETTATFFRLERSELLALLERAHFQVVAQRERTEQLRDWHAQRYATFKDNAAQLAAELGETEVQRLLCREQTTVELLTSRAWTSFLIIAEKN